MRGDELTPWLIRYAYSQGAFPMTMDDGSVEWFQPHERALFPIEGIHVSRSLSKVLKRVIIEPPSSVFSRRGPSSADGFGARETEEGGWGVEIRVTFDTAFEDVMRGCLRPGGNWISGDFIRVYTQIHHEGWAHSVEVWRRELGGTSAGTPMLRPGLGYLVGGLYGLALGSCFCAESMFHRATDASKVALWAMVNQCRELGFTIFDAQVMNPHLESLGAYSMPNEEYLQVLEGALGRKTSWSGG